MPRITKAPNRIVQRNAEPEGAQETAVSAEREAKVRKAKQDKMIHRSMSAAAAALMGTTGFDRTALLIHGAPVPNTSSPVAVRIANMQVRSEADERFRMTPDDAARETCTAPKESANHSPPIVNPFDSLWTRQIMSSDEEKTAAAPKLLSSDDVRVWTHENGVSSQGQTKSISLENIQRYADGSIGNDRIRVRGQLPPDTLNGHAPYDAVHFDVVDKSVGEKAASVCSVTVDHFDQGLALATATELMERLERYGVDLQALQSAAVNDGKLVIEVNATDNANAYYSRDHNHVVMGRSSGQLSLGSDRDILVHEIGHYLIHQISGFDTQQPFAGALHEGIADVFAALMHNDPEIGESFDAFGMPHARNAENHKAYAHGKAHAEAESIAAVWWDAKNELAKSLGGDEAGAADLMMKAAVLHLYRYENDAPSTEDFVRNSAASVDDVLRQAGTSEDVISRVVRALRESAAKRNLGVRSASAPNV